MKKITSAIFLIFIIISCKEETPKDYYSIKGKIKNYNGTIYLNRELHSNYYLDNFKLDSVGVLEKATVVNGEFEFKLSKKYNIPFLFHLGTDNTKTSSFILDTKNQQIIIDSLYFNVKPQIICENSTILNEELLLDKRNTPALEEFKFKFNKIKEADFPKDSIEKLMISARRKLTDKNILILKDFTINHPNSYVSFWYIVRNQMYNGYNIELEKAYNNLSNTIKQSKVAKVFEKSMLEAKTLHNGTAFPEIKLKNKELKEINFNAFKNSDSKYILVDFWFSYCGPCIAQFPKLKELQKKYSQNQLKIISISTDKTKNVDNWFKVVDREKITWLNLLDENGAETSVLGINKFPTNYLLNKEGIILERDISLIELEELLNKKN